MVSVSAKPALTIIGLWLGFGAIGEMNVEINAPLRSLGFLWARDRAGTATSAFAAQLRA